MLNEQRNFSDGVEAAAAIREMTDIVCRFPLEELLALRWTAEDVQVPEDGDGGPVTTVGTVWTQTEITARGVAVEVNTAHTNPDAGGDQVAPPDLS